MWVCLAAAAATVLVAKTNSEEREGENCGYGARVHRATRERERVREGERVTCVAENI